MEMKAVTHIKLFIKKIFLAITTIISISNAFTQAPQLFSW